METKKLKVIYWQKEVDKAGKSLVRQMRALFVQHMKEATAKKLTTAQANKLWRDKYQARHDKLDMKQDMVYKKLWDKYHTKDGKVKAGYTIKF